MIVHGVKDANAGVLFTAPHSQLVVMCLQPGEAIGDEVHPKVNQFFFIEQGEAKFIFNENDEHSAHDAVVVPAGTYHNVVNTSKTAMLKLYAIYSPPNHPDATAVFALGSEASGRPEPGSLL